MEELDALLDFIEDRIDEEHVRRTERLHLDAMAYNPVPHLPLTLIYPPDGVELFPYEEAFFDPGKMLYNELIRTVGGTSTYTSVQLRDDFPPQIRSNHGIGILSSLFGAHCRIINDNMPWVEPMELAEVKKAVRKGVPDLYQALGKRVVDTHQYYLEKLKGYPKCFRCVRVTQPDLQGPFDVAHLLLGNDIFLDVYDYPDLLHDLLDVITDTYIAFRKKIDPLLTDRTERGAVYLHGCLFGGMVLLKDDTATSNLSEDMYRSFSKAYNDRIFAEFGGGSIHYCGPSRSWAHELVGNRWLKGINFGNPEMQNLAEEHIYWGEKKVPILLWGDSLCGEALEVEFLNRVRALGIDTGMSLALRVKDLEQARNVFQRHRF